jgi:HEAT repeat protein
MTRFHALEAAVFAVGLAIGVACANDSNAQPSARVTPDDTAAVGRLLGTVRGAPPLVCEMTARAADMHGWFNGRSGAEALVTDSASAALLDWVQRSHDDPALVAPLSSAMRDSDACVRRIAASLLSRVRHVSAVTAMTNALGDAGAGTREVAALGLGMAEAQGAGDALGRRLRDAEPAVRRAAAWALGELEVKSALPALIDLLARDTDARVRQAAAWAIGNIH